MVWGMAWMFEPDRLLFWNTNKRHQHLGSEQKAHAHTNQHNIDMDSPFRYYNYGSILALRYTLLYRVFTQLLVPREK